MLNCLFIVQGEGRGHMTQALALRAMLARAGHRVSGVLVGRSSQRKIPPFFLEKIGAPIQFFASPTFVRDTQQRGIRLGPTLGHTVHRLGAFRESLQQIDEAVRVYDPDVIVNFFEPLAGLYNVLYRPAAPLVCIGHQYLFLHPVYPFPPEQRLQQWMAKQFTALTSLGAAQRLALSFYPAPDLPEHNLTVVPPLLRDELFEQPLGQTDPFVLTYVLNRGYAEEIERWHARHPEVELHCFWDNDDVPDGYSPRPNLTFHHLDDERFLAMMARCRGLVCTAGFESVCEAMYLGKPVLMVPVDGHFEQHCNAVDAERMHAGLHSSHFAVDALLALAAHYQRPAARFRPWVAQAEDRFLHALEAAALQQHRPVVEA